MTFQPLANADIMKLIGRGSDSLNSTVYLSRALISLTALNRTLRGMLIPGELGDAVVGGLHVLRGQLGAGVELHALAQMERVGLAVRGNFPAMRQIRDDRLGAVVRIAPDQIVEHAGGGTKNEDGPGLVNIEMGARNGMPWRSTPPDLAFGSGALSLNPDPSNFSGTGAASAK